MENASEALMMAFAVMVFVIALTVGIVSFNNVKKTSDIVLYSVDETNYYEYQGQSGKAAESRIVGLETIIPTLYKYYKENYTIVFQEADYYPNDPDGNILQNVKKLTIYSLDKSLQKNWQQPDYKNLLRSKYNIEYFNDSQYLNIFSFDLDEETLRHEPWTGSYSKIKENLDCFLDGTTYKNPNNNTDYIKYDVIIGNGGFRKKYANDKFVENITEYRKESIQDSDSTITTTGVKDKAKRIIIYTRIRNV